MLLNRFLVLVIYDISNDRRRNKMVKFLNSFGIRVQESAFECILNQKAYNKLLKEIKLYRTDADYLRVYKMFGNTEISSWDEIGINRYGSNPFLIARYKKTKPIAIITKFIQPVAENKLTMPVDFRNSLINCPKFI